MNQHLSYPRPISPTLPPLTVTQLTQAIQRSLEATFPVLWVQGEISNFTRPASGHLYFSIKDANTQISAMMFRTDAAQLKVLPSNGDMVKVCAELTLFPARGIYQLVVRELSLTGIGELLLKFEERKKALKERGWFDEKRKRPLPHLPKRIGVVTSPTGAVIQDILHILTRRYGNFHLILYPVKVQGEGAAEEIALAIEQCNRYAIADVLIVGRGGGSIEDLWAFNEECVASAIFHSRIPIISAVGHETDYTIADWVADKRAPTPSAAAEMVLAEKTQLLQQLTILQSRLKTALQQHIRRESIRLQGLKKHPYLLSLRPILGPKNQQLDYLQTALQEAISRRLHTCHAQLDSFKKQLVPYQPARRIQAWKEKLSQLERALYRAHLARLSACAKSSEPALLKARLLQNFERLLNRRKERLRDLKRALFSVSPTAVLERGYGLVFSEKDAHMVTSVESIQVGQRVRIKLFDGQLTAAIDHVELKTNASTSRAAFLKM